MGVMNKEKGLRTTPYMKTDELIMWMKLCVLCGELEACAKATQNKKWRSWLNPAKGLVWKVVMERINMLDPKQAKSIARRREHSEIKLYTSDELRLPKNQGNDVQDYVTVAYEDLLDVVDLANNSCCACPQGECVKDCYYRKVFHRISVPVLRDNPKDGECEFSSLPMGVVEQVKPRNQRGEHYYLEDYVL